MSHTMTTIFIKTDKGRTEVDLKAGGLSAIERRVLIYIDGKRTIDELRALPKIEDIQSIIQHLLQQGYIAANQAVNTSVLQASKMVAATANLGSALFGQKAEAAPQAIPAAPSTFRPIFSENDVSKLPMAKNFMSNTLRHFVGAFAVSGLTDRIQQANNHGELRLLFDEWSETISSTRQGRAESEKLRKQLLEII
jgi:hypothetical protein